MDDFKAGAAWARRNELDDKTLSELEDSVLSENIKLAGALARAYLVGYQRGVGDELAQRTASAADEAEHARKRGTKIRESFLASVRANVNLLASMTADERKLETLSWTRSCDYIARTKARALMVETWGQEAVDAALGGGS